MSTMTFLIFKICSNKMLKNNFSSSTSTQNTSTTITFQLQEGTHPHTFTLPTTNPTIILLLVSTTAHTRHKDIKFQHGIYNQMVQLSCTASVPMI